MIMGSISLALDCNKFVLIPAMLSATMLCVAKTIPSEERLSDLSPLSEDEKLGIIFSASSSKLVPLKFPNRFCAMVCTIIEALASVMRPDLAPELKALVAN